MASFNEDVQNVDATDFSVDGGTTASVTDVDRIDASTYEVTISGGDLASFDGTVGLNLAGGQNIIDVTSNAIPSSEPTIE